MMTLVYCRSPLGEMTGFQPYLKPPALAGGVFTMKRFFTIDFKFDFNVMFFSVVFSFFYGEFAGIFFVLFLLIIIG